MRYLEAGAIEDSITFLHLLKTTHMHKLIHKGHFLAGVRSKYQSSAELYKME